MVLGSKKRILPGTVHFRTVVRQSNQCLPTPIVEHKILSLRPEILLFQFGLTTKKPKARLSVPVQGG